MRYGLCRRCSSSSSDFIRKLRLKWRLIALFIHILESFISFFSNDWLDLQIWCYRLGVGHKFAKHPVKDNTLSFHVKVRSHYIHCSRYHIKVEHCYFSSLILRSLLPFSSLSPKSSSFSFFPRRWQVKSLKMCWNWWAGWILCLPCDTSLLFYCP